MKQVRIILVVIAMAILILPVLAEEIQIGNGTTTTNNIPLKFYYKNSLTETIYYADEFAAGGINTGAITELTYYYNFVEDLMDFPFNIWMGETTLTTLPTTWIPAGELTQVFEGTLSFFTGTGEILIELDEPYVYNGDNLVIMVERVMDTVYYSSLDVFYYENTPDYPGRCLYKYSDTIDYDPYTPPAAPTVCSWVPNTLFEVSLEGLGSMNGHVYNVENGLGIEGVLVELTQQDRVSATTDGEGFYEFPGLLTGEYEAHASLFGYYDETVMVMINEDEVTIQDFDLAPFENADISGRVVGSDNPTVGIAGAELCLDGLEHYEITGDNEGNFIFSDVYANTIYQLTIVTEFYETYVGEVNLGFDDLDLGDVIVNEISFPVNDVIAVVNDEDTEASLIWHSPVNSTEEFFDFNNNDGDFTANQGWGWGTDATYGNGTNIWGTDLNATYPNSVNYQLTSPEFHISGDDIILTFSHYYDTENYWDGGNVKISIDGGSVWTLITPVGGYPEDAASTANAGIPGEACYSNNSAGWVTAVFELSDYEGEDVLFKFHFGSDGSGVDGGWFIDDFALCTADRESLTKNNEQLIPIASISPQREPERIMEGYRVYRLPYGEEGDETNWVEIAAGITDTTYLDMTWAGVESGLWRYAVKAEYTNGVLSDAEVSNWLGKDMYSNITVNITTNVGDIPAGAEVDLVATAPDPDGEFPQYNGIADDIGICYMNNIWKSTYYMEVNLFSFDTWEGVIEVIEDEESYDVMVIELAFPPADVEAEINIDGEVDLIWHSPMGASELFFDFEEDDGEFISMAGWAWGTDATAGAYSGTNVWGTILNGNYAASCNYQLITPEFVVPGDDAVLTFWHWYDTEANLDGGNVKISLDGGATWEVIHPIGDYPYLTGYSGNAGIPNEPCFTSHNQQYWEFETFEIGEFNGDDAMIKFHFGSDSSVQYPGWFIDDVRVGHPEDRARDLLHPGSRALESYSIYRGLEGDEENYEDWDLIEEGIVDTTYEDITWSQIIEPDFYKYCVRAEYTNAVLSDPSFSNWLEANFVANVTVNVTTNVGDIPAGAFVELEATVPNPSGEYYYYSGNADDLGIIIFSGVYYGNYDLYASLEGFEDYEGNIDVSGDMTVGAMITELAFPPAQVTAAININGETDIQWHSPMGAAQTFYDFEDDDGEFISNNAAGWGWGIDANLGSNSGEYVWATALNSNYLNNADWQLTSPEVTIYTDEIQLTFYHNMDCENSYDGGNVKISLDGGNTWAVITPEGGYPDDVITGLGEPGYTDGPTGWQLAVFDLSVYNGEDVMFMWNFGTDSSVTSYPGWAIDDVMIGMAENRTRLNLQPGNRALEGYTIYRGLYGDEANFANWDLLAAGIVDTTYEDITWSQITEPDYYKYCVRAEYTNGVLSDPSFSNWLEANFVANVTVSVSTNVGDIPAGAYVELEATVPNPNGEYYFYSGIADEQGTIIFSGVYYGNYDLIAELEGYATYEGNIDVDGDMTVEAMITELAFPVYDVMVEQDQNGFAFLQWHSPSPSMESFWDFEEDDGEFISMAGWAWGTDATAGAYSGSNVWGTVLNGNYIASCNYQLITPEFVVPGDDAVLTFWHWYDTEANLDGGNVKISIDGGATWQVIHPIGDYPNLTGYSGNAGIPNEPCFTSHNQQYWEFETFEIGEYDSEDAMIKFHFGSDSSVQYPGWYIDDVRVGSPEDRARDILHQGSRALEGYSIYRGLMGDEANVDDWDLIVEDIIDTTYIDESWANVTGSDVYRYAVKAEYTNGVYAEAGFSNWLAANMYAVLTINLTTNVGDIPAEAYVHLEATIPDPEGDFPEYEGYADDAGVCVISGIWMSNYDIEVELFNFMTYEGNIEIDGDMEIDIVITELSYPPRDVTVEESHTGNAYLSWHSPTGPSGYDWDFEDDDGEFVANMGWAWGTDTMAGAHSGVNVWGTVLNAQYPNSVSYELVTPEIEIPSDDAILTFWHWYDIETTFDGGNIKISTDGGSTWTLIPPVGGYNGTAYGLNSEQCFNGHNMTWLQATFEIGTYQGEDVMFKFHFGSDSSVTYQGWYIDDVMVGEPENRMEDLSLFSNRTSALGKASDNASRNGRMLEGYNVYRGLEIDMENFEAWEMVAEACPDTTLEDETWSQMTIPGVYVYCVRALYTNNILSDPAFSNTLSFAMDVPVVITVNTDSGDNSDGAYVEFVNQDGDPEHIYTGIVSNNMISFGEVFRGTYDLVITLDGFNDYYQTNININDATSLMVTLEELIWIPQNPAVDDDTGLFTWDLPAPDIETATLNYDSGINDDGIGLTNGGSFSVSARWDASDISDYDGWIITAVRFFPRSNLVNYTIKVCADENAGSIITDQLVNDFTVNEWNEIELGTYAEIDASTELWVGYAIANQPAGDFPAGCDAGPAVAGYGDMITTDGTNWELASELGLDVNWNIQVLITSERSGTNPVALNTHKPDPARYKNSGNDVIAGMLEISDSPSIVDILPTRSVDYYNVYRDGDLVGQTMQLFFDFINITGWETGQEYTAGVSAHYTSNNESDIAEDDFICLFYMGENANETPLVTTLTGNYPNPFNPATMITYQIAEESQVKLEIYNTKGQMVKRLVNEIKAPGYFQIEWNGIDNRNRQVASGIYFYRLTAGNYEKTSKMIMMK